MFIHLRVLTNKNKTDSEQQLLEVLKYKTNIFFISKPRDVSILSLFNTLFFEVFQCFWILRALTYLFRYLQVYHFSQQDLFYFFWLRYQIKLLNVLLITFLQIVFNLIFIGKYMFLYTFDRSYIFICCSIRKLVM